MATNATARNEQMSDAEWAVRKDLAAAYRLVALYGWDDLVFTHLSARVPGPEHHFLINPYGFLFDEITASSLIKVDENGEIVDPGKFKELKLGALWNQLRALKQEFPQATRAPTMRAAQTQRQTYIHERGEFRDRGADVQPGTPGCLPGWQPSHADPRRNLADWLVSDTNPLTARVMVNRVWQHHFGRGIVATPNDFGRAGHPVSNAALLDWLADEFVKGGWSVKHMHRVIMKTRAYQRSSAGNAANEAVDPGNIHHWRGNLRRLEAEVTHPFSNLVSQPASQPAACPSIHPPPSR